MALERAPRVGQAPGTRTLDELKRYDPPRASVLRVYTVGKRPGGQVESLADVAKAARLDFWAYIDYVFPGCEKRPECVNWYLHYRHNCSDTHDHKNRIFKGGEQLPLPKSEAKPLDPPPPSPRPGFYNRHAAASYALRYAQTPNQDFPPYNNDCTSFVSQCLHVGGWPMVGGTAWDYNNNSAWWYGKLQPPDYEGGASDAVDRFEDIFRDPLPKTERYRGSQTWAGADHFARFLKGSHRAFEMNGPEHLEPGDVIQLRFKGTKEFHHTMIVVERNGADLRYAQHSDNKLDSYQNRLLKVVTDADEIVHWKLKDQMVVF